MVAAKAITKTVTKTTAKETPKAVALEAGRASIGKSVNVDVNTAKTRQILLKIGQPLHIKVPYHAIEQSQDRESYLFTLQCTVSKSQSADTPSYRKPVQDSLHDRRGFKDDFAGTLTDVLAFDQPGEYAVQFTITAEYVIAPWNQARVATREQRSLSGLAYVHVS